MTDPYLSRAWIPCKVNGIPGLLAQRGAGPGGVSRERSGGGYEPANKPNIVTQSAVPLIVVH